MKLGMKFYLFYLLMSLSFEKYFPELGWEIVFGVISAANYLYLKL